MANHQWNLAANIWQHRLEGGQKPPLTASERDETVLAREFLAPSSHLKPVFDDALRPKFQAIRRMLGEIAGLPEDDPAITRCAVSVAAPCLMLLVGGPNVPGPLREIFQMPRDAVVAHLHRFALGGLQAIAQARESSVGNS
mgnify:CR=1 FL=1